MSKSAVSATQRQQALLQTRLVVSPHPVLTRRAHRVRRFDDQLAKTLARMGLVLLREQGLGLAAPQVGDLIRACIAIDPATWQAHTLINPHLAPRNGTRTLGVEGCLSLPGVWVRDLPRWDAVVVQYDDLHGKARVLTADGAFARVLQHEIDHLDGILITDRVPPSHRLSRPPQHDDLLA